MVLASHCITFPIANTNSLLSDLRTFLNADPVADGATTLESTCIALAPWFLAAQMPPQFTISARLSAQMTGRW
jgi:hypothetical protein